MRAATIAGFDRLPDVDNQRVASMVAERMRQIVQESSIVLSQRYLNRV